MLGRKGLIPCVTFVNNESNRNRDLKMSCSRTEFSNLVTLLRTAAEKIVSICNFTLLLWYSFCTFPFWLISVGRLYLMCNQGLKIHCFLFETNGMLCNAPIHNVRCSFTRITNLDGFTMKPKEVFPKCTKHICIVFLELNLCYTIKEVKGMAFMGETAVGPHSCCGDSLLDSSLSAALST